MALVFSISNFFFTNKIYQANELSAKKKPSWANPALCSSWDKKMFISVCTLLYVVSSWVTFHSSEILVKKSDFHTQLWYKKLAKLNLEVTSCDLTKKKYCAQLWFLPDKGFFKLTYHQFSRVFCLTSNWSDKVHLKITAVQSFLLCSPMSHSLKSNFVY